MLGSILRLFQHRVWTWRDRFTIHWPIGCKSFGSNNSSRRRRRRRGEISTYSHSPTQNLECLTTSLISSCWVLSAGKRFSAWLWFSVGKKEISKFIGRGSYFRWRDLWMPDTKGLIKERNQTWFNLSLKKEVFCYNFHFSKLANHLLNVWMVNGSFWIWSFCVCGVQWWRFPCTNS